MPELVEQMYCSQQIVIPPKFPYILKRYCKAAIKTQPYDLLRWSFEYFKALAHKRPPPVKLRLEYPVYSTEGGLTRGCLKVLANQLAGMQMVPLETAKAAWRGFCLDPEELRRIFCLCEVYKRAEYVSFLQFIAVAGGMLTKSLTHTMILLCETLTKEPDGGSAAIPVHDFLIMYRFLARMDASTDMKYVNGFREGWKLPVSEDIEEEEILKSDEVTDVESTDDYWQEPTGNLQKLTLINDHVGRTTRLSVKLNMPLLGKIERSPSAERAGEIERKNFLMERKGRPHQNAEVNEKLRQLSVAKFGTSDVHVAEEYRKKDEEREVAGGGGEDSKDHIEINIFDEDDNPVEVVFYGEPGERIGDEEEDEWNVEPTETSAAQSVHEAPVKTDPSTFEAKSKMAQSKTMQSKTMQSKTMQSQAIPSKMMSEIVEQVEEGELTEKQKLAIYVNTCYQAREERREDLIETFDEIAAIVDRFMTAHYDLGMVAGRQMSITSGEFIVAHIEKEILEYIDDQIAILPDPDLKKKKAKPEEVAMIRELLETFLDENMDIIAPELEEVEEEEEPIPDITLIYAVPGIGGPVDEDTIRVFEEYAQEACKVQADVFMPRNIRHFMCPPLEKYEEYVYEDLGPKSKKESLMKKEEVPIVGKMTD